MPLPAFYDPQRIGTLYPPQIGVASDAGQAAGFSPAAEDTYRIYLLLVDMQIDFVHPDGALSVPGAVEDTRRIVEWLYTHSSRITTIGATLDSHMPMQIFHPAWWVDASGRHPEPFTTITSEDVHSKRWRALYEVAWSADYVQQLEDHAKKLLMIWPYHALIGTPGHALVPALSEAIAYHSVARQTQPQLSMKGTIPKTEHYSAVEPEVQVPDHPQGSLNKALLDDIATYDLIYIAGEARSHCVLETVTSMMRYFPPEVISKVRILEDAMSSVVHPEIDFDILADEIFGDYAEQGLTLTNTTAPLG